MLTIVSNQDAAEYKPLNLDLPSSSSRDRVVYGSHKDIYQDIAIIKPLTKTKFPIYLVNSQITKKAYAMKVFPYNNGRPQLFYKNESRFSSLRHENVVRNLYFQERREATVDGASRNISYTIMEYASNGDFFKFLKEKPEYVDEKLARTYFRQLIEGLEYLHKNGVAHMDLKLDNLLISDDFTLKIADFDIAHYVDDTLIISNGTKFFRAPEVGLGRCNDPKAADIYSAGVILFNLITKGTLPQFENELIDGLNFADLLANDTYRFWTLHSRVQRSRKIYFDQDFKGLFEMMTKLNPNDRASIEAIKASSWYNKPCYTAEELKSAMNRAFTPC